MASRQVASGRVGPKSARAIKPHADKAAALLKAREARVVTTTREAQSIRYALSSGAVTRIIEILYKEFCAS